MGIPVSDQDRTTSFRKITKRIEGQIKSILGINRKSNLPVYRNTPLSWHHKFITEVTIPGLINQKNRNFTVWLMIFEELPKKMLDKYEQIVKENDNFEIIYVNDSIAKQWSDAIAKYDAEHGKNPRYRITTRIDDDNIYSHGIEALQKHAKSLIDDNIDLGGILVGKRIDFCVLDKRDFDKKIIYKECKNVNEIYTSSGITMVSKVGVCNKPEYCNIYGKLGYEHLLDLPYYVNKRPEFYKNIKHYRTKISYLDNPDIPFGSYTIHGIDVIYKKMRFYD